MNVTNYTKLDKDFFIDIEKKTLPKNIYAIKVFNVDEDIEFDLAINHDGYSPDISQERNRSRFNDYLCALEYKLTQEYFKLNNINPPKSYYTICEVMTDGLGDLITYSKVQK